MITEIKFMPKVWLCAYLFDLLKACSLTELNLIIWKSKNLIIWTSKVSLNTLQYDILKRWLDL